MPAHPGCPPSRAAKRFLFVCLFCRFVDKTRNDWSARRNFVKYPGKYDLVEIDYSAQVCISTK